MNIMTPSEMFEQVLARPGLYTSGGKSIIEIAAFMHGFTIALEMGGMPHEGDIYFGFQKWVEDRYKLEPVRQWQHIITYMSPDEDYGWERAKELWGEYKSQLKKHSNKPKTK